MKIGDKAIIEASQITAANQFPSSENAGQRQMPQGCYCLDHTTKLVQSVKDNRVESY